METILYRHVLAAAAEVPWAITHEKLAQITTFLATKAAGGEIEPQAFVDTDRRRRVEVLRSGAAAIVPVYGTIAHRAGLLEEASGGTSTQAIAAQLRAALADPDVRTIVLDVDSPGGAVSGVAELADEIHAAREQKQIVAVANTLAASAAYWLASQAHQVVATPSARVGSIGVYAVHQDLSQALEAAGVKVTLLKAGKHKAEGNPFGPLSDDDRAAFQELIDQSYASFVKAVARGRGVTPAAVRNGFGEGRVVHAAAAVELGMADRVATFDDVLARASVGGAKQGRTMRAEADSEELAAIRAATEELRAIARRNR